METVDLLVEERLVTMAGTVIVSVAGHRDGSRSAVARLLTTGQRVGYGRRDHLPRSDTTVLVDETVVGPSVAMTMRRLLQVANRHRAALQFAGSMGRG